MYISAVLWITRLFFGINLHKIQALCTKGYSLQGLVPQKLPLLLTTQEVLYLNQVLGFLEDQAVLEGLVAPEDPG